jgi:hypothetical protein
MKITIESTGKMACVEGVRCRIWNGITDRGVKCEFYVMTIAVDADADQSEFEREFGLNSQPAIEIAGMRQDWG